MFILIWRDWTATLQAEGVRDIRCEVCEQRFLYRIICTGVGVGRSYYMANERGAKKTASLNAEWDLKNQLEKGVVPMPCPGCGRYQQSMIRRMKRDRYPCSVPLNRWTVSIYLLLTLAVAICGAMAYVWSNSNNHLGAFYVVSVVWSILSIVAVPYVLFQHIRRAKFDPYYGTTEEERIAEAQSLCWAPAVVATPLVRSESGNAFVDVVDYRPVLPDVDERSQDR